MAKVTLTLRDRRVRPRARPRSTERAGAGVDLNVLRLPIEEMF
jgi:hypothetical protein